MNSLADSLQYLKGVGPHRVKKFKKLGIATIEDLLYHFPYRYEDRSRFVAIAQVEPGQHYTLKGKIMAKGNKTSWRRRGFHIFEAVVTDERARIFAVWFNQPYLNSYFKVGQSVILYGKAELYKERLQISNPEFEIVDENSDDTLGIGRIVPIYPLTEGFSQRFIRHMIKDVLDKYLPQITDVLPYDIRKKHSLLNIAQSLLNIHFPASGELNKKAYMRLAFEEFFLYQIPVLARKLGRNQKKGITHTVDGPLFSSLVKKLPFTLTHAQERVLSEIKADMAKAAPMQRLLQGEVASGKTIVALLAAAIACDGGYQVAFMAPTEILAKQHFATLSRFFAGSARVALLINGTKKDKRKELYHQIQNGEIAVVVGTHALIQEGLAFKNVGLVLIDEQHKFGVAQRGLLPRKGKNPDTLIMTATPIPRTLSMTVYGDLDVSVIDELPKGRQPITTRCYSHARIEDVYEFVRHLLQDKQQAYVVCPVIEESLESDLSAVKRIFQQLKDEIFKEFHIAMVHGSLDEKACDAVMDDFRKGALDILVATSVLEVGIDIPNATCMVVLDAERFGLSQLHQLRGRVGRGTHESFFLAVSDPVTEEAKKRIAAIEALSDGFRIAEEDLRIRGPGEFFGRRQHGLSMLKIANPLTQLRLLKSAREEAFSLLRSDPLLSQRQHQVLLLKMKKAFPRFPDVDIIV